MAMALDLICLMFTTGASVFAITFKDRMDSELLAFTLQILTDVIVFFSCSIRMSAEIENYLTSSQRLYKYTELESEDSLVKTDDS